MKILINFLRSHHNFAFCSLASGSSVARLTVFGPQGDYVACLTHIESLSIWHLEESVPMQSFGDLRPLAGGADYAVDCFCDVNRLYLLAGMHSGALQPFHVSLDRLDVSGQLSGTGHSDTVRTSIWLQEQRVLITGGDDGQVLFWS